MTTVQGNAVQHHSLTEFAAVGQDAIAVVIQSVIHYGRDANSKKKLADYRISSAELCYIPCRCCCYQSKSRIELDPTSNT